MRILRFFLFATCSLLFGFNSARGAEFSLASPFTNHMVLQRDQPVPVWGTAKAGAKVTVNFAGQKKTAVANDEGKWQLKLDALKASEKGAGFSAKTDQGGEFLLSDVIVGEVWICSGQSNMQMGRGGVAELKDLSEKNLRTFEVKRTVAFTEQERVKGKWAVAGPGSAVAFGFAHFLAKETDVPVGVILAAWGSSSIEAWMPRDMTGQFPHFKTIMEEWDANTEAQEQMKAALAKGKWTGPEDVFMRRQPCILYNAMIKPLAPYACRGLVWYQGERNTRYITGMPDEPWYHRVAGIREYDEVLKGWMQRYRKEWGRDDFHFLLVMLPGYGSLLNTGPTMQPDHPASHSWAWMRESQLAALDLPYTGVANTIDLGDVKNIHPKDKAPIGQRLALLAARDTLGSEIEASGPVFANVAAKGDRLVVQFDHAEGLKTTDGEAPGEFWIADQAAKKWKPAVAKIVGQTVQLHSPEVANPAVVRYAFTGKPNVNLVNEVGLPAFPFRTDQGEP
ncbi:MAG: sialate O-acetylesterase [Verrucomicrobiales bacterium]|nr:sialate O-acetylesterase [Verrucomicrobiales bacterium]